MFRVGVHLVALAPWWWRLARRLWPARVREVPEPTDPGRLILRQFALQRRRAYLQAFCGGENPDWYHSHQFRYVLVFVLWGSYTERRRVTVRRVRAPWVYLMGPDTIHQVTEPRSHTSIAIGFGRDESLRRYYHKDALAGIPWTEHVKHLSPRI
jgi:hypothetical protein